MRLRLVVINIHVIIGGLIFILSVEHQVSVIVRFLFLLPSSSTMEVAVADRVQSFAKISISLYREDRL